jgi:hypothetical protein
VALVSDDALETVAGILAVVIFALLVLLIWRHGGPHDPEPPE